MQNYDVYFEIYGKKLKTTVLASSIEDAKRQILDNLKFHKIAIKEDDTFNQLFNTFFGD